MGEGPSTSSPPSPGYYDPDCCPDRVKHRSGPDGYVARQAWADAMMLTHEPSRCYGCGYWMIWTPKEGLMDRAMTGRLVRTEDETGVSGTGVVAWVVQFPDGRAVTRWCASEIRQTCVWDSVDEVLAVHGHDGRTVIVWDETGETDG